MANNTKKQNVITIGGATQDIIVEYADIQSLYLHTHTLDQTYSLLTCGEKIDINSLYYSTGGGATNSAVSFKRLGYNASTCFALGNDLTGKYILEKLAHEQIPVFGPTIENCQSGTSIIIPSGNHDRTIFTYRGANGYLENTHIPYHKIDTAAIVYITSLSNNSAQLLPSITKYAKQKNILVAHNPGSGQLKNGAPILKDSLTHIDILILNSDEAKQLMLSFNTEIQNFSPVQENNSHNKPTLMHANMTIDAICFHLRDFMRTALAHGPELVAVTNGSEGVYIADKNYIYFHPSIPAPITCTTLGAGDAFGSCFVASLGHGDSLEVSLIKGIINASSVIGSVDAKEGLLNQDTLNTKMKSVDLKNVQKFSL